MKEDMENVLKINNIEYDLIESGYTNTIDICNSCDLMSICLYLEKMKDADCSKEENKTKHYKRKIKE